MSRGRTQAAKLLRVGGSTGWIDVPVPKPGFGEILLDVKAYGICGADLAFRDKG